MVVTFLFFSLFLMSENFLNNKGQIRRLTVLVFQTSMRFPTNVCAFFLSEPCDVFLEKATHSFRFTVGLYSQTVCVQTKRTQQTVK